MARAVQKRRLETRARLVAAAQEVIDAGSFEGLRVEQVVQQAGVAKGTFFAHFPDKDALMDLLIGARMDSILDRMVTSDPPRTAAQVTDALMPLLRFMTCERYVFDVILRHSGAAARAEIGPIATTFGRQIEIMIPWLERGPFRKDVAGDLLAEGIQAFAVQAMALKFCALHNDTDLRARLAQYLDAWLMPAR
ncbi:TetR/AcrR family transcriptional regulator [Thiosulfatihalobacter marinus]|uniref:TetR/AcrR family transcriptional regulator n=1 Tax=Thiosulfatihalobacter marinus TaxID=2792481 RepID=UPI0018D76BCB|nr:TetR/AcrR family transcriptional regulator [Thiosulfatihalobacter marinus]